MEDENLTLDDIVDKFHGAAPKFIEDADQEGEDPQEQLGEEPNDDDTDAEAGGEGDEASADADAEDQGAEDPETEIEFGGATHKVKRSELTALYQTREATKARAAAVVQQNRLVESQGLFLAGLYEQRVKRAEENLSKFASVDLFQAYRNLDPSDFENLKAAKEAAEAEHAAVTSEAQNFMRNVVETRKGFLREQARQSIGVIREAIPEWNDDLYGRVRAYAVSQGMDADAVNEVVDASAIVMMHKAMLYDDARAKTSKVTQKAVKAPKKVATKGDSKTDNASAKQKRLTATAIASGNIDDVTDAFLAAHRS